MKILVISRSPWDNSNSFGNTFSNLFGGMKGVEIYNVCCQDGINSNDLVREAYQMTDRSVLLSLKGKNAGRVMTTTSDEPIELPQALSAKMPKKRYTIFYIARDMIWNIGLWWNNSLKDFLHKVNPDIIYLPLYSSCYMCDVQQKIVDYCNVPVAGHISDDLYNYPPNGLSQPLAYLYRGNVRRKIRKLISKCSYVEVFAENMANEYHKIFRKPFYIIGKGIDIRTLNNLNIEPLKKEIISYVYTGNIGNGRYLELAKLAKSLDYEYTEGNAELRIYTQSMMEEGMQEAFAGCKSIKLCGSVSSMEVRRIQREADILVHVESFSEQSVFETKMSFSTKLIDYMLAGKIIFAIGPAKINSLEVLRNNHLAITACSDQEISQQVSAIKNHEVNTDELSQSIRMYLKEQRDICKIQEGMMTRFKQLVNKKQA